MHFKRRDFITLSAVAGSGIISGLTSCSTGNAVQDTPSLQSMTKNVVPISTEERQERIAKAQRLMTDTHIEAIILDAGTSLKYFTGISWWPSERPMVAIIPARGEVSYICPAFEEERLRELLTVGNKVYIWHEDESPYSLIVTAFKDSGIMSGSIGIEECVRFFIVDGVRKQAPHLNFVSADPVVIPCRLIKSPRELALMQTAFDVTLEAMKTGISNLQIGMTPGELAGAIASAHKALGAVHSFAGVSFGVASSFPHGSSKPQELREGDIVLMDCGCTVEGYASDITRTIVMGEPSSRQIEIWNLEKKAQSAGFQAAQLGATGNDVDTAARQVLIDAGFGPGYQLPGLPHRTGHGIGMDVHEWGNMVKGNMEKLQTGMCFSIEPTIAIPGEFGIRHEDCVYMTENGPVWFTQPAESITQPFAGMQLSL